MSGCPLSLGSTENILQPEWLALIDGGNTLDSQSGIGGGGFNWLLEHHFKPKPVRQDPPLCSLFLHISYYILHFYACLDGNKPEAHGTKPLSLFGSWEQEWGQIVRRKDSSQIVLGLGPGDLVGSPRNIPQRAKWPVGSPCENLFSRRVSEVPMGNSGRENVKLFSLPSLFSICHIPNPGNQLHQLQSIRNDQTTSD